mmetsp:Transcript_15357/g.40443  ORF Transcript_15357/g.40443 Transcript_15357/m.40443 type:complete len:99 (+) Transcript_15357:156-452(+)
MGDVVVAVAVVFGSEVLSLCFTSTATDELTNAKVNAHSKQDNLMLPTAGMYQYGTLSKCSRPDSQLSGASLKESGPEWETKHGGLEGEGGKVVHDALV